MRRVYKYDVPLADSFFLELPSGAEVLSVQVQNGEPRMWVLLNPENDQETRRFYVAGTGHPITHDKIRFIDTFQMHDGRLIFHVFEEGKP